MDNPNGFFQMFDDYYGTDVPLVGVVGNHDLPKWNTTRGYRDYFLELLHKNLPEASCQGEYGVNMVCIWHGMVFVLSGVGTLGTNHASFIDTALARFSHIPFKICAWHKNQRLLQTGFGIDETGYEVYDICRKHGAIIATGHDHSYARTHLMSNFENQIIASSTNASSVVIERGKSFAFVAGLGGFSMVPWQNKSNLYPWWASTATVSNGANYGALFCIFNEGGNAHRAKCCFEDIDENVWDSFEVISKVGVVKNTQLRFQE